MTRLVLTLLLGFLSTCCPFTPTRAPDSDHRVKVGLYDIRKSCPAVTLHGRWHLSGLDGREAQPAPATLTWLPAGRGVSVNGRLWPDGCLVRPVSRGAICEIAQRTYRGHLEVRPGTEHGLWLVLDLDLEDYVTGVVACEAGRSFHPEALKAQAVACRTFGWLRHARERRVPGQFDLFDSTRDQVFRGLSPIRAEHRQAARVTEGKILTYRGEILQAFFHSTCGGHTINSAELGLTRRWSGPLQGVSCDNCRSSKFYRWTVSLTRQELLQALGGRVPSDIRSVEVDVTEQGMVRHVTFVTPLGGIPVSATDFRKAVGLQKIRSGRFDVVWDGRTLVVSGRGWGHGAGLCQYGAEGQARRGAAWRKILEFYYPGSRITDL